MRSRAHFIFIKIITPPNTALIYSFASGKSISTFPCFYILTPHENIYYSNLNMDNNIKRWMGATICCFMLGSGQGIIAQKVVFPQTQQAGTASIAVDGNEYTLKNNLLTAKFVKQDGSLFFNGCEEMNLKAGTELFKVVLGDGTTFTSSQMTLQSVEE